MMRMEEEEERGLSECLRRNEIMSWEVVTEGR